MLKINNLTKNFGTKKALDNLSYDFENKVYGLLGPNGAGKTTLLRCITKLYKVKSGDILYLDQSIFKNNDILNSIGYLPQKFGAFKELKVHEMLELLANLKGIDKHQAKQEVKTCLELVNLEDRANDQVGSLSGGMVRRLGIAQAVFSNAKIILFDEPTTGLDPEERIRFKNIISKIKQDRIIIISTHIVEDVESICDTVIVMNDGDFIRTGSVEEIRNVAVVKVYEIAANLKGSLIGEYHIQKLFEQGNVKMMRVLTAQKQSFAPVNPTIEDGYICILKSLWA